MSDGNEAMETLNCGKFSNAWLVYKILLISEGAITE